MKFLKFALIIAVAAPMIITSCSKKGNKYDYSFDVPDSVAYSIGLSMGNYLQQQGIRSVDIDAFEKGMAAGVKMGEDEATQIDSISGEVQKFMVGKSEEAQAKIALDSTFKPEPYDLAKDVSFNFGVLLGSNLDVQNLEKIKVADLVKGVGDQFANTPKYKQDVSGRILENYFLLTDSLRITVNEKYLEDNKSAKGVETTASGLQYKVITKGDGPIPTAADQVKVNYKGTFVNGKTFDSSYDRGEPAVFPLAQVIPGWTEGIALMPVGSKYEFAIPYNLAYGEQGSRSIPPKSTLVFEVELLEIVPAAPAPAPMPEPATEGKIEK